jgi:acyl carrier protein
MEDLKLFVQQEIMTIAFTKVGYSDLLLSSKLLDSITVVDLIVSIEERIGKKIPQHLLLDENFDSIDQIAQTVAGLH